MCNNDLNSSGTSEDHDDFVVWSSLLESELTALGDVLISEDLINMCVFFIAFFVSL